jgi:hypothetical protein
MVAAMLVALPILTNASGNHDARRNHIVSNREQGTTQPITLRSVTAPNSDPNTPPGNKSNWVFEIKVYTPVLTAGGTVKLVVSQILDPNTFPHKVKITQPTTITFGQSVNNISTATVTVPIEAQGDPLGGTNSVNLQGVATVTEAQTQKVTSSSVSGTFPFVFPQTFNIVAVPSIEPPMMDGHSPNRPRIRRPLYVQDYYDYYVTDIFADQD